LAVNVAGRGLALITGCGHPSLERIVARAEALFDRPVVGVIGGLHYEGMAAAELAPHIDFLAAREPAIVALSPHDSDALAIDAFRRAFPAAYRSLEVGQPIHFAAAPVAHGGQ
jgi:7,8-dihydropterin-6-yl-methyl-4-(beta-D-ribofuranosyl)aminobenzene 5'-phosphate synthase